MAAPCSKPATIDAADSTLYVLISALEPRLKIGVSDSLAQRITHLERVSGPIDWNRSFAMRFNQSKASLRLEGILHRLYSSYKTPLSKNVDGFSEWFHSDCLDQVEGTIRHVTHVWTKDSGITVARTNLEKRLKNSHIPRNKPAADSHSTAPKHPRLFRNADRLAALMPTWLHHLSKLGPDLVCLNASPSYSISNQNEGERPYSLAIIARGTSPELTAFLEIRFGNTHILQFPAGPPLTFAYFPGFTADETKALTHFQSAWQTTIDAVLAQIDPSSPELLREALSILTKNEAEKPADDPIWDDSDYRLFSIDGTQIWMKCLTDRLHTIGMPRRDLPFSSPHLSLINS